MTRAIHVVNVSDAAPGWHWTGEAADGAAAGWTYVSMQRRPGLETKIKFPNLARMRGSLAVRRAVKEGRCDLLVSHGPYNSFYGAQALHRRPNPPHLAVSFNFTDIPGGMRHKLMCRAYRSVDRFVVASTMERALYARVFDLPEERFDFCYWGVNPPIQEPLPRTIEEPYFIAIGNEARDYRPLVEAARMRPRHRFVFVVRPWTLDGLDVPDNVTVRCNLPWDETWSLVWHAAAGLISLRDRTTPNGHVSLVGGMRLGKAHIVSDSSGIADYVIDGETALVVPTGDAQAFVQAIDRLSDEPETMRRLGEAAQGFARRHCTEQQTVDYFSGYLADLRARGRLPA